jgi:hypothetical protein
MEKKNEIWLEWTDLNGFHYAIVNRPGKSPKLLVECVDPFGNDYWDDIPKEMLTRAGVAQMLFDAISKAHKGLPK